MTDTPAGTTPNETALKRVPLHDLHLEAGAKMVPFAGYEMPVQYAAGVLKEHAHTREQASLFDVSHMGQAWLRAPEALKSMESLVPADVIGLAGGSMAYTFLTTQTGGILDDLMITQWEGHLFIVVNASRKDHDFTHMEGRSSGPLGLNVLEDQALLALQGPKAEAVLQRLIPATKYLTFMSGGAFHLNETPVFVTRSGYTGEDGFEISIPADAAEDFARLLVDEDEVKWAGLGARDSLRLEAGLCLYGQDIDETTTPLEAGLAWAIPERRRSEGGYPGAEEIRKQWLTGPERRRVGITLDGKAPARAGAEILDTNGRSIGHITSGGYGPTVGGPIAMGYVEAGSAVAETNVQLVVRDNRLPAKITKLPFVKKNYAKT